MNRLEKMPDTCLIKSAAKGDKQAFGLLYQRYLNEIYRFVFYKVGNIDVAEDITEDTFVRTWERLIGPHDNKREIINLRAWLYQTASNLVIDHYRKIKPVQFIEKFTHSKKASPEEITEDKDISQVLMETIRSLKPEFQQIIILRFINELSHEQTASIMKISTSYSRVLQYRALKKLETDLTKKVGRYVE
jgi:RNA polymerase sigma-70 factor, ECF subfamily